MSYLLRQGAVDSLLQVAATTLTRLGLVVSVLILSFYVGLEQTGRFDLFVLGSTLFQLAVTVGMDSGLAIASKRPTQRIRNALLAVSFLVLAILVVVMVFLLETAIYLQFIHHSDALLARAALAYGASSGILILFFSWLRWQQRARMASILLISSSAIAFTLAALGFTFLPKIEAFAIGLCVGNVFGIIGAVFMLTSRHKLLFSHLFQTVFRKSFRGFASLLISISIPYVISSVSLILRRLADRSFVIYLGDPKLLGAFALLSRFAELIAFAFSVPAVGFSPIIVARHSEEAVKRLSRLIYLYYVFGSLVVVFLCFSIIAFFKDTLHSSFPYLSISLALPIVAGTLFLGEVSIAAYGYIISRTPRLFTLFSTIFVIGYAASLGVCASLGYGISSIFWTFLIFSFVYSTLVIYFSERLYPFRHSMKLVFFVKSSSAIVSVIPLFQSDLFY